MLDENSTILILLVFLNLNTSLTFQHGLRASMSDLIVSVFADCKHFHYFDMKRFTKRQ